MNSKTQSTALPLSQLAEKCIAHLEREEASLASFVETARQIQAMIIEGQAIDDQHSISLEHRTREATALLAAQRDTLRGEIAGTLNVPMRAASIKAFAQKLDPVLRQEILQRRERILALTKLIERINRTNNVLIHQTIDLQQRLHLAITGSDHSTPTYGSSGLLNKRPSSSVIETEC